MESRTNHCIFFFLLVVVFFCLNSPSLAVEPSGVYGYNKWWSFAGNFEGGFRKTQYFESDHNALVGMWDSRLEFWLPPSKNVFSWGPYIRIAGIAASQDQPWENAWLALPGVGLQVYPFSLRHVREGDHILGKIFGPVRIFGEYNSLDYWGTENSWRPGDQVRIGMEYWRNLHANDLTSPWWTEVWSGLIWQSSNEFDEHYDTLNFGVSLRSGLRVPNRDILSLISPYVVLESSLSENKSYYWENRLIVGGGLRIAPSLSDMLKMLKISRLVFFLEYDYIACHYYDVSPSGIPNYDIRIGLNLSLGDWFY